MKFLFSSSTTNSSNKHKFHENLFKCSPKLDHEFEDDDDDEYTCENEHNQFDINDLSLPLTGKITISNW